MLTVPVLGFMPAKNQMSNSNNISRQQNTNLLNANDLGDTVSFGGANKLKLRKDKIETGKILQSAKKHLRKLQRKEQKAPLNEKELARKERLEERIQQISNFLYFNI